MKRRAVLALVRGLVRLFYRSVEVSGAASLPAEGPLLLVANHANGLVDPMVVLAIATRPIVFVAKSTLWRIPLLSSLLDVMGVVPVIRRVDVAAGMEPGGEDRNTQSFQRLARVLAEGGAVLIFPEGRSHSEPALSAVKTGAARIRAMAGRDVAVVPLGLWFTRKEEFRSEVLVKVGPPVPPPADGTVEAWTDAIAEALTGVTLNADSWRQHEAARAVEAIYGEGLPAVDAPPLDVSFTRQRLLQDARRSLERVDPEAVARLARRAAAFERLAARSGVDPRELDGAAGRTGRMAFPAFAAAALGLPVAALGVLAFAVPYRLVGLVAPRLAGRHRDQLALMKLLSGAALHAAALVAWVAVVWTLLGAWPALVAAVLLPAAGLVALVWADAVEPYAGRVRAALTNVFGARGDAMALLRRERDALRQECARLEEVYRRTVDNPRT